MYLRPFLLAVLFPAALFVTVHVFFILHLFRIDVFLFDGEKGEKEKKPSAQIMPSLKDRNAYLLNVDCTTLRGL